MQEDREEAERVAARLQAAMPGHVVQAAREGAAVWDAAGRYGVHAFEEFGQSVLPDPWQERLLAPGAMGRRRGHGRRRYACISLVI